MMQSPQNIQYSLKKHLFIRKELISVSFVSHGVILSSRLIDLDSNIVRHTSMVGEKAHV